MLRGALSTLLSMEKDFEVIKEVSNGQEALNFIRKESIDVALIDIEMPVLTGIDVLKAIRQDHLNVKVIILTTFSTKHYITDALKYKVNGYLLKDTPSDELADHIRKVIAGKQVISSEMLSHVLLTEENPLTKKEKTILQCVEKGYTSKQIAEVLYLSNGTVRNYLSEILQKLDAQNRTEAAFIARNQGWLDEV